MHNIACNTGHGMMPVMGNDIHATASCYNYYFGIHTFRCYCCGGGIIRIDSVEYLFKRFPEDMPPELSQIDRRLAEPIPVILEYEHIPPCDNFPLLEVTKIELP